MTTGTMIASFCGGAISAATAGVFLLFSEYPRTIWFVLRYSAAFYVYAAFYGAIGTLVTWLTFYWTTVVEMISAARLPPAVILPLLVGVSATLLKTGSVNALSGSSLPPVWRTLLLLVEPPLLRRIKVDEFYAICAYLKKYEPLALEDVKRQIASNVPDTLPDAERDAFLRKIEEVDTVRNALIPYLRFVGRRGFEAVFDLR